MVYIIRFENPVDSSAFSTKSFVGKTVRVNPGEYVVILGLKPLFNMKKTCVVGYTITSYTDTTPKVKNISRSIYSRAKDEFDCADSVILKIL